MAASSSSYPPPPPPPPPPGSDDPSSSDLHLQLAAASATIARLHNLLSSFLPPNPPPSLHNPHLPSSPNPTSSTSRSTITTTTTTTTGHARFRSSTSRNHPNPQHSLPTSSFGSKRSFLALSDRSGDSETAASTHTNRTGVASMDIDLNGDPSLAKDDCHDGCRYGATGYSDPVVTTESHGFSIRGARTTSPPPAKSPRIDHDSKTSSTLSGSGLFFDLNEEAPSSTAVNDEGSFTPKVGGKSLGTANALCTEGDSFRTLENRAAEEMSTVFFRKDGYDGGAARLATDLRGSGSGGGGEMCTVNDEGSFTPKVGGKSLGTLILAYNCAAPTRNEGEGERMEMKGNQDPWMMHSEKPRKNSENTDAVFHIFASSEATSKGTSSITASETPSPLRNKVSAGATTDSKSKCSCRSRKLKKKWIVRVPAISEKIAEIPSDNHRWRKYGQKAIKGSPYPRNYYRCSGVKGCPATKNVERDLDDPTMLIVSYKGEHVHPASSIP